VALVVLVVLPDARPEIAFCVCSASHAPLLFNVLTIMSIWEDSQLFTDTLLVCLSQPGEGAAHNRQNQRKQKVLNFIKHDMYLSFHITPLDVGGSVSSGGKSIDALFHAVLLGRQHLHRRSETVQHIEHGYVLFHFQNPSSGNCFPP